MISRIRYQGVEVSKGYVPEPSCRKYGPCSRKLSNGLWLISSLQAVDMSGQSTVWAGHASSWRESPGCGNRRVGPTEYPWFTAESRTGAPTGLQNKTVIITSCEGKRSKFKVSAVVAILDFPTVIFTFPRSLKVLNCLLALPPETVSFNQFLHNF